MTCTWVYPLLATRHLHHWQPSSPSLACLASPQERRACVPSFVSIHNPVSYHHEVSSQRLDGSLLARRVGSRVSGQRLRSGAGATALGARHHLPRGPATPEYPATPGAGGPRLGTRFRGATAGEADEPHDAMIPVVFRFGDERMSLSKKIVLLSVYLSLHESECT